MIARTLLRLLAGATAGLSGSADRVPLPACLAVDEQKKAALADKPPVAPRKRRDRVFIHVLSVLCLLAACIASSGCAGAGAIGNVFFPEKIPAAFEPPDQKTVIFVDDPANRLPNAQYMGMIAAKAGQDLKDNKAISDIVDPATLEELRFSEPDFNTWPIDKVGRQVGAAQVIYVVVNHFSLTEPGGIYRPNASVSVKVVDVMSGARGKRLFPPRGEAGHPLMSQMHYKNLHEGGRSADAALARRMADRLGEDIAKLFYDSLKYPPGFVTKE